MRGETVRKPEFRNHIKIKSESLQFCSFMDCSLQNTSLAAMNSYCTILKENQNTVFGIVLLEIKTVKINRSGPALTNRAYIIYFCLPPIFLSLCQQTIKEKSLYNTIVHTYVCLITQVGTYFVVRCQSSK